MTSKVEILRWLERGLKDGATHVIIVVDTFDHGDYPVYVFPNDDVRSMAKTYNNKNMQSVMEVYNLSMDLDEQLDEHRAFNYENSNDVFGVGIYNV